MLTVTFLYITSIYTNYNTNEKTTKPQREKREEDDTIENADAREATRGRKNKRRQQLERK